MTRAKAWWAGFALTCLMCLGLWNFFPAKGILLDDTDTIKILHGIHERRDPWHWFVADWPLANHFYRPVSSLLFEYDDAVHPGNDSGYGKTNAGLAILTLLGFFWLVRELTDSPAYTTGSTWLFYLWTIDGGGGLSDLAGWLSLIILLLGLWRHHLDWRRFVPAALVWYWLSSELAGIEPLSFRMLGWIPGRTASSMTVFAFISLAAFCRYERLGPLRESVPSAPTAMDRPATKSSSLARPRRAGLAWPILAIIAEILALGCYEQAVTIPAVLGMIAIYWHLKGHRVRWSWGIGFGLALVAYLFVRNVTIPPGHSEYYNWQKRSWGSALMFLQRYLFFPFAPLREFYFSLASGLILLLTQTPWIAGLQVAASLSALWQAKRRWLLCGFGWLTSTLAYAPMAWFKDFGHYHYFPMGLRAIGVVGLGWVAVDLSVIALSRRVVQAPPRLSPAPGSLPHQ